MTETGISPLGRGVDLEPVEPAQVHLAERRVSVPQVVRLCDARFGSRDGV